MHYTYSPPKPRDEGLAQVGQLSRGSEIGRRQALDALRVDADVQDALSRLQPPQREIVVRKAQLQVFELKPRNASEALRAALREYRGRR